MEKIKPRALKKKSYPLRHRKPRIRAAFFLSIWRSYVWQHGGQPLRSREKKLGRVMQFHAMTSLFLNPNSKTPRQRKKAAAAAAGRGGRRLKNEHKERHIPQEKPVTFPPTLTMVRLRRLLQLPSK